jgi:hypothetical protein
MAKEFSFSHLSNPPRIGDAMHFHAYGMAKERNQSYRLALQSRLSTDADGIARCLGLRAEARVGLEGIMKALQTKISPATLFNPV